MTHRPVEGSPESGSRITPNGSSPAASPILAAPASEQGEREAWVRIDEVHAIIQQARDSICAGGLAENAQHERSVVEPYLDGIADELDELSRASLRASPAVPVAQDERENRILRSLLREAIEYLIDAHPSGDSEFIRTCRAALSAATPPAAVPMSQKTQDGHSTSGASSKASTTPPQDSFPDQTILHAEQAVGNCLQATVAGILGWPLDAVPHFALLGDVHWWDCLMAWLDSQGLWIDYKADSYKEEGGTLLHLCWLSGPTVRGTHHAVIGDTATGQMVHDPHPSRAGLTQTDFTVYFFRKPAPSRRSAAEAQKPNEHESGAAMGTQPADTQDRKLSSFQRECNEVAEAFRNAPLYGAQPAD